MNLCVNLLCATSVCSVNTKLSSSFALQAPEARVLLSKPRGTQSSRRPPPPPGRAPAPGRAPLLAQQTRSSGANVREAQTAPQTARHGGRTGTARAPRCRLVLVPRAQPRAQRQTSPGSALGSTGQTARRGLQSQPCAGHALPPAPAADSYRAKCCRCSPGTWRGFPDSQRTRYKPRSEPREQRCAILLTSASLTSNSAVGY